MCLTIQRSGHNDHVSKCLSYRLGQVHFCPPIQTSKAMRKLVQSTTVGRTTRQLEDGSGILRAQLHFVVASSNGYPMGPDRRATRRQVTAKYLSFPSLPWAEVAIVRRVPRPQCLTLIRRPRDGVNASIVARYFRRREHYRSAYIGVVSCAVRVDRRDIRRNFLFAFQRRSGTDKGASTPYHPSRW